MPENRISLPRGHEAKSFCKRDTLHFLFYSVRYFSEESVPLSFSLAVTTVSFQKDKFSMYFSLKLKFKMENLFAQSLLVKSIKRERYVAIIIRKYNKYLNSVIFVAKIC